MEPGPPPQRSLDAITAELQSLRESAERLRALTEVTSEGILIHDRGIILDVNPAFLRLVHREKPEELIGRSGLDVLPFTPESRARVLQHMRAGSSETYDVEIVQPDGSIATMETGGRTLTYRGRPARFVFMRDVSEQRRAEQQRKRLEDSLQQAQKMESIGRLAGGIAHDFNNLLTAIGGYASVARAELVRGGDVRACLDEIVKAVDLASSLTQRLLTFSRKQIISPKVIDLNEVVTRVSKMLERLVGEHIELTTSLAPNLGRVRMDPGQIEQILVNLAVNAHDAMPQGGRLVIETANVVPDGTGECASVGDVASPHVKLAVTDCGTGMDAETQKHLFEPFFTTKPRGEGTGLGLAMVYGAVQQNGGRIEVRSELGRGTSVAIYLPQVEAPADVCTRAEEPKLLGGTETIVLVEDAELVRSLGSRVLRDHGYEVHAFANGDEALAALPRLPRPVHLLFTDVVLPGMNGRVLAERMRELMPHLRVLFASGHTEDIIVDRGVLTPGIDFIAKPYAPDLLVGRVRQVLDRPD